jgi:hypothetical protein
MSTPHSSQHSSALLETNSADRAGGTPGVEGDQSQDPIFSTSHPETNISEKIKKACGMTLTALQLLEKSADAFPAFKSAIDDNVLYPGRVI